MIKNVIFDVGGVILDYHRETYLSPFGFDSETEKFVFKNVLFTPNWSRLLKGEISTQEFIDDAIHQHPDFESVVKSFFDMETLKKMLPVLNKTVDFVKELKNEGYKLFIISDIEIKTIDYLLSEIPEISTLFDDMIFSSQVHMVKKDGLVFDYALKRFNIDAKETLFVDDADRNLEQAQKYGINTFKFTSPETDISQIKTILKQA